MMNYTDFQPYILPETDVWALPTQKAMELLEYLENKAGQKTVRMLLGAGKKGPVIGGILGVVPQAEQPLERHAARLPHCVEIRGHRARGIGFVQATAVADGTQGGRLDHVRIPVHLHWSADKKPRRVSHELHVAFVGGQIHAMGRHDIGFHPGLVPPDIRQNRA